MLSTMGPRKCLHVAEVYGRITLSYLIYEINIISLYIDKFIVFGRSTSTRVLFNKSIHISEYYLYDFP